MELEVDHVVGPKGKWNADRTAKRHGHERGAMILGGRRVQVSRPRMRTVDDEHELPVGTYEFFADRDPLTGAVMDRMLAGVSTRKFAVVGEPVGEEVEAASTSTSKTSVPRPPQRAAGWASSNWSGYAATGSVYSSVTDTWTVAMASPSRKPAYSSEWVGIDGFNNSNLIQTGTESDYYNGSVHYDAWWEILPAAETVIPSITVKPGDVMTASITKGTGSWWTITITDKGSTTHKPQPSFTTTQSYTGPATSAEWIEEAPTVGGRVATLASYGLATFDLGTANGANPGLNASESGVMVQNGRQVSTPSNPDSDTDGFNAAYGSATPTPPPS